MKLLFEKLWYQVLGTSTIVVLVPVLVLFNNELFEYSI